MLNKKLLSSYTPIILSIFFYVQSIAQTSQKGYVKNADGVLIYPDVNISGNTKVVRLQVISDKIIRVTASPTVTIPGRKSLIIVNNTSSKDWTVVQQGNKVMVKTPAITATVLQSTGAVSFADKDGKPVLMERQNKGREFRPAVFTGEPSYGITQTFETTSDDAYYGLGQHQDEQFNYKGKQVFMFQNNTEVAIPFLISNKNYGILWDNYSISKIGDTRDFIPLSSLRLYSKEGDLGWLTASYSNDRKKPNDVAFVKAESDINYSYLNDTKNLLPKDFNIHINLLSIQTFIFGISKTEFVNARKV